MTIKKITPIALMAGLVLILFLLPSHSKNANIQEGMNSYVNVRYGIEFLYPKKYILTEKEVGDLHRGHYAVTLFEDTPTARDILSGKIKDTEGPPAISVDIFQNNLDKQTLKTFVTGTNYSNFKLGDGTYSETTVGGVSALHYFWNGLYRGESYVFSHIGNIVMLSGTYLESDDAIRADFETVRSSFILR